MEDLKKKYCLDDEMKALNKLILNSKISNKEESCFTLEYFGQIKPGKVEKLKNDTAINVYAAEIADDESITEYYYLDIKAIENFNFEDDDEETFQLLVLGEIDPREAQVICE